MVKPKLKAVSEPLRLDLGCGANKKSGFIGVDARAFPGVDKVVDLTKPWPWADGSVAEVNTSHFVEHLTAEQRIHFVNELYRVLMPDGKATVIVPHWASTRAYGDLTHQWPPVSEMWFHYLSKEWRDKEAPHNDFYRCDFNITWGYALRGDLMVRNAEYQQFAIQNYKEVCTDIISTWVKKNG